MRETKCKMTPEFQKWSDLLERAKNLFPGWEVEGVIPGIEMVFHEKNGLGDMVVTNRIVLTEKAVETLEKTMREKVKKADYEAFNKGYTHGARND